MCGLCRSHSNKTKECKPVGHHYICAECGAGNHPNPGRSVGMSVLRCWKCGHVISSKGGFLFSPGLKVKHNL